MPQLKNPITGQVVSVAQGQEAPYLQMDKPWTVVNETSSPGFNTPTSVITADSLKPEAPIKLPTTPEDNTNYQGIINGGMTLADQFKKTAPETNDDLLKAILGEAPQSLSQGYGEAYKQSGLQGFEQDVIDKQKVVKQAQNEFDLLNAELRSLNAEAKAVPIKLQEEATGRGITAGGLAPLQAGELRKIALRSLPLEGQILAAQAKVMAAQGDAQTSQSILTLAQQKFDRVFELKSKDIENTYNYKKSQQDRIWEYLTKKEQQQLEQIQKEDDRKYQESRDNINLAQKIASEAMNNSQPDIAAKITALDPKSATFQNDLAFLQGKIKINEEKAIVADLAVKYVDAGISLTDTLSQAQAKLRGSRIYQEQIRPPQGASLTTSIVDLGGGKKVLINSKTGETIREFQGGAENPPIEIPNLGGTGKSGIFIPSESLTSVQKQKVNTVVAGTDLINQAEKLYNEAVGKEYTGFGSGVLSRLKGLTRFGGGITGTNEKWKAYQNFLDSNRAPIAKGIKGEVGNLAENEQKNALKSFPGAFSSPYEANVAFNAIRSQAQSNIRTLGTLDIVNNGEQQNEQPTLSQEQLEELKKQGLVK